MSLLRRYKKNYIKTIELGEIKSCPFCGSTPRHGITATDKGIYVEIRCPKCGIEMAGLFKTYDFTPIDGLLAAYNEVVQEWNGRGEPEK